MNPVHVNGWFGDYDKLPLTRRMLRDRFAIDFDASPEQIALVGDSPKDSPMFSFFGNAVGVQISKKLYEIF